MRIMFTYSTRTDENSQSNGYFLLETISFLFFE